MNVKILMKKILIVNTPAKNKDFFGGPKRFTIDFEKYIKTSNYNVIIPRNSANNYSKATQLFILIKTILKQNPDLIILTTYGFHIIPTIFFGKILRRAKIISIIHSLKNVYPFQKERFNLSLRYIRNSILRNYLEKLMINHSDYKIIPSKLFLDKAITEGYLLNKSRVIHHFVNDDIILINNNQKGRKNILIIVGSFLRIKGAEKLSIILNALPNDYQLKWIGYNKNDKSQEDLAKNWLSKEGNNFQILEQMDFEKVIEFIDNSAILLVPSLFETFGMVALESCARAIPVIVSKNCGVSEIIHNSGAGEVISFESPKELSESINKILSNYLLYSSKALQLAKEYSWAYGIKQYLQLINQAIL